MRKITVLTMLSLDGVMQAPGGPEEDTSGGFKHGGWTAPYSDEQFGKILQEELQQTDYLLGRKTYDIFASYWPHHAEFWPGINEGNKYVLSQTQRSSDWKNTQFVGDVEAIKQLKNTEGADLQIWGSSELIQLLLQHDLVDEFRLKVYPLILGEGKKLFQNGILPAAFTLAESVVTSKGVIIAHYKRAGEVVTGDLTER
ncbi:dihydrofolate reductase family protein [Chitinophaga pendula]|uniref:dihydrofolate reductase family protein n=1 Tax=Chitinophaga TaxID=79328 RepID=UPI000BB0CB0E|nr:MULTISPECIES: dihydrofolate reductase family protein [Chitinophaga]ASZ11929.1 dihydrofolate reductase [Chitinophaga sp. MD30]UCJ05042.1 dihydrofolate reductase family protein [Chitinophaga pendula]